MDQYERFFKLLYSLIGAVVGGVASIGWLNDCLQAIVNTLRPTSVPRPVDTRAKRKHLRRRVISSELSSDDWYLILEFCKESNPRFLALAEYFHANNNALTKRKVLRKKGFIPPNLNIATFEVGMNYSMSKAGIHYAIRANHSVKRIPLSGPIDLDNQEVQFYVLKVVDKKRDLETTQN